MKRFFYFIFSSPRSLFLGLLFGFTLAFRPATALAQPRQIALLIGIGDYPQEGGWQKINAVNDLGVIGDALRSRGFQSDNIIILKDQQATRDGILNVWRQVLLPKVRTGDVVYFQFSGHGQQVADDNGDEVDGYDEAIVPYDSPLRYQAGVYQGENLIRDDELNSLISELRLRLGPTGNLMVVLDACHSGTGTRGMEPARGTDIAMASDDYIKKMVKRQGDSYTTPQYSAAGDGAERMAPMAAFFGSAQNQLNFEARDEQGQFLGSLTYALSRKLSSAAPATSYRGLFEQVRVEMGAIAPRQQPQAEGTLDQEILGGRLLPKPQYYRVIRWNDPASVAIDAGWISGLNNGAVLGLYPPETRDPSRATPIAKGTISMVQPFEATLQLDKSLTQEVAEQAWAYVLEQNLGDLRLGLAIRLPENHPVRKGLLEKISGVPMIRLDESPELYVTQEGNEVHLIGHGDVLLESLSGTLPPAVAATRLYQRMLNYAQAKYLRQMDMPPGGKLNVEMELVPVKIDPSGRQAPTPIPLESKRDALGNIHFQDGDFCGIRIRNNGDKAAYYTVLDIQPDNVVNPVIPDTHETASEFRVGPGQTIDIAKYFSIGPPAGVEMFKLIVTEQPVDLSRVITSRGAATRANQDPLEKLFGQTYFNEDCMSRGGKTINLAAGSVQIQSFNFIID